MRGAATLFLLAMPSLASAAWPEDVSLSSMTSFEGERVLSSAVLGEAYGQLIRELGVAVGSRSVLPAETLGAAGFEVALTTQMAFTTVRRNGEITPWQRAHTDNDPGQPYWAPSLMVRKGLPFSLEVGVEGSWVGLSRQGTFGGWLRAGLVEGYKPFPDVSVHAGYTGFIGNDELELGVFTFGATIGSTFAMGSVEGARQVKLAPYADLSLMWISAAPVLDTATVEAIGAVPYGSRGNRDQVAPEKPLLIPNVQGGIQLVAGRFVTRLSGGYAVGSVPTAQVAVGLTY